MTIVNVESLMADLKDLNNEIFKLTEASHKRATENVKSAVDWNFYIGQMDGYGTTRYKLQQLIEKYT